MTRSASGARQGGDDYQHLVAWTRTLLALRTPGNIVDIGLEAPDAGNVDDVTITYTDQRSEFSQVKYSVDASSPINLDYLMSTADTKTSILAKFHSAWRTFSASGPVPRMQLVTNKLPDPTDNVITGIDSRTGLVVDALNKRPKELERLAAHLDVDADETLALFGDLEFHIGRAYPDHMTMASVLMEGRGMRSDEAAVRQGIDLIRQYVLGGSRVIDRTTLVADVDDLDLQVRASTPALAVQSIGWDPTIEEADEVLDWVELFDGDSPRTRRRPKDPTSYAAVMQPELDAAAERLLAAGHSTVRIRGFMRLPAWFAVGAALPRVRHVDLEIRQGPAVWSTAATPVGFVQLDEHRLDLAGGTDLALVLAITNNPTDDVVRFIEAHDELHVGTVAVLSPAGGAGDTSVDGDGHAVAITQAAVDTIRAAVADTGAPHVHLFAASPGGLMAMLGHRWNRIAPTTIYEDTAPGYLPSFQVGT